MLIDGHLVLLHVFYLDGQGSLLLLPHLVAVAEVLGRGLLFLFVGQLLFVHFCSIVWSFAVSPTAAAPSGVSAGERLALLRREFDGADSAKFSLVFDAVGCAPLPGARPATSLFAHARRLGCEHEGRLQLGGP